MAIRNQHAAQKKLVLVERELEKEKELVYRAMEEVSKEAERIRAERLKQVREEEEKWKKICLEKIEAYKRTYPSLRSLQSQRTSKKLFSLLMYPSIFKS